MNIALPTGKLEVNNRPKHYFIHIIFNYYILYVTTYKFKTVTVLL